MGGENEKPLQTKVRSGPTKGAVVGGGRIHEDTKTNKVHFHEGQTGEADKLRVAIEPHVFHQRFTEWSQNPTDSLTFIDSDAKTKVVISRRQPVGTQTLSRNPTSESEEFEVDLIFSKITIGANLQNLINFAESK